MKKQTLILTGWLSLPFVCLTVLMVWIFTSLDTERLMDEPPVGAGAGDTGNANALGQYLAGRDPDAISDANTARRDGLAIDPFNWPGGTLLTFEHELASDRDPSTLEARIVLEAMGKITILIRHPQRLDDGRWGIRLDQFGGDLQSAKIAVGYRTVTSDSSDWALSQIPIVFSDYGIDTPSAPGITVEDNGLLEASIIFNFAA